MGHSKIDLTMNCYADPRLLDVSGALDQLPALSLNRPTSQESATALVTGTDDQKGGVQLAQWLATNSDPVCISGAKPVTLGKMTKAPTRPVLQSKIGQKNNEKRPIISD